MNNKDGRSSCVINVKEDGIEINDHYYQFPLLFSELKKQFGENYEPWGETDTHTIYMWHKLGIKIFVPKNENDTITISVKTSDIDEKFLPKNKFCGDLKINNQHYNDFFAVTEADRSFKNIEMNNVRLSSLLSEDEFKTIEEVSIWQKAIKKRTITNTDKYKHKKIPGEKIIFADFNFKLAIIEELMYNKELIQPKFDIFEFTGSYKKREINTEAEGCNPIPEAIEYFENLEIDKAFAEHITQIYQDGGMTFI